MAKKQHGGKREGAGRKTDDPAKTIAVTVPEGMLKRLDVVAETNEWNRSEAVREGIQLLLDSHEPVPLEKKPAKGK